MATVIDFSPSALEIDQVADAVGIINPNINTLPPQFPYANPNSNPNTDPEYANRFISASPDILFVAEYGGPNMPAAGALVVWEAYYNATHYELYRRDYLAQDDSWQRVLLIDTNHLAAETVNFQSYISDVLKIPINYQYYAILDTDVGVDKITEYKVVASFYPSSANIDYGRTFLSKGLINTLDLSSPAETLPDFAQRTMGSSDYAWIVALLNSNINYFGKDPALHPLSEVVSGQLYVPKDPNIIPKAFQESIYFFGLTETLRNVFNRTGNRLQSGRFFDDVLGSVNESAKRLSYVTLQSKLSADFPNYKGHSQSGFVVPQYADTTHFNTLGSLNLMFLRLNTFYLAALYTTPPLGEVLRGGGLIGGVPLGGGPSTDGGVHLRPFPLPLSNAGRLLNNLK